MLGFARSLAFAACAAWMAALPAAAILIDLGDGSGNTSAPPDDPGWGHVAVLGGLTGVYVGSGWVLTAAHVQTGNVRFIGDPTVYAPVPGTEMMLTNPDSSPADLKMYQITPVPPLPPLPIASGTPAIGAETVLIGRGRNREPDPFLWLGTTCFQWQTTNRIRWGTNQVFSNMDTFQSANLVTHSFLTHFTAPSIPANPDPRCTAGMDCPEGQGASGDSGGAAFIRTGGAWRLAGIAHAIVVSLGQPSDISCYGNRTVLADLDFYRDQVIETRAGGPDLDEDAVADAADNCPEHFNPDQGDYNGDGFGNLCDGDFDDDGAVGLTDFAIFRSCLGLTVAPGVGSSADDPDCGESDMDDSGVIGILDFAHLRACFGLPAGCVP